MSEEKNDMNSAGQGKNCRLRWTSDCALFYLKKTWAIFVTSCLTHFLAMLQRDSSR